MLILCFFLLHRDIVSESTIGSHLGSSVGSVIKKMWDEEREHLDTMERLSAKYNVPHTKFSPIFSAAAYALGGDLLPFSDNPDKFAFTDVVGVGSALLGKEGAMACTIAVEELIGQHYNDQLKGNFKCSSGSNIT